MRTKKKISLTIDRNISDAMDEASRKRRMAKSRIAQEALELWFKRETEFLMARGYEEMADEDQRMAEFCFEAQREVVK